MGKREYEQFLSSSYSFHWVGACRKVAAPTSMSGGSGSISSVTPTIYKINATTGVATPFMTFRNGDLLKAITILKQ